MIDRGGTLRWLFWPSLTLSIALHLGAVAALYLSRSETPGAVDRQTTAISVNLETTDILDSPEQSEATAAAAPAGQATPPEELKPEEEQPEEPLPEPEPPQKTPPERPKPVEAEQPALMPQPQPPEETAQEQPEPAQTAERERIAEEALRKAEARERARKRRQEQRNAGASGSQGAQSSQGRVSASHGSIRNYAAMVRSRIARNKPGGPGGNGRVVISFALSASGNLISARVVSSSGDASLDQSALSAVRQSSPFPAPPPGSSPRQLSFTMPFQFR